MDPSDDLPSVVDRVPKIRELQALLGFPVSSQRRDYFMNELRTFRYRFPTHIPGITGTMLLDLKSTEQKEELLRMATQFADEYGTKFWRGPSTGDDALCWPGDEAIIRKHLGQLLFRINYTWERNHKNDPRRIEAEDGALHSGSLETFVRKDRQIDRSPVAQPIEELQSSPSRSRAPVTTTSGAANDASPGTRSARRPQPPTQPTRQASDASGSLFSLGGSDDDSEHDMSPQPPRAPIEQASSKTTSTGGNNSGKQHDQPAVHNKASDSHRPSKRTRYNVPMTFSSGRSGEASSAVTTIEPNRDGALLSRRSSSSSFVQAMPGYPADRQAFVARQQTRQCSDQRNTRDTGEVHTADANDRGSASISSINQHQHQKQGSSAHPPEESQARPKLNVYFYVLDPRSSRPIDPWRPKGKRFLDMSLEELVSQLPLDERPAGLQFGLKTPDAPPSKRMIVSVRDSDTKQFERMQNKFREETRKALECSPPPSELVTFEIEIEPYWEDLATADDADASWF